MAELHEQSDRSGGPRDLLRVIFRRKWLFLTVVAVAVVWVIYNVSQMEPLYESASKLLVSRGFQPSAFSPGVRIVAWEEEFTSEIEAISSDRIRQRAEEILAERGVVDSAGLPYEINTRAISAETRGKSHILFIRYRGREPEHVQDVVRALTAAYQEFRTEMRHPDPTSYLQGEIDQLGDEIAEWEDRRAAFLVREGVVQLPEERSNLLTERRTLEQRLSEVQASIAEHRARLEWLRTYSSGEREDPAAGLYAFHDPTERTEPLLMTLRRKILEVRSEYFAVKAEYTDSHPAVLALHDRLRELETSLESETRGYIQHLQARLDAELAREGALLTSLDYVNEQLSTFPDREAQLARLDRTIGKLRDSYDALVKRQLDAMTTKAGASPWDVVVLQEALDPYPVASLDHVRLLVVLLFSIFVGAGLALLRDNLDHTFRERNEVEAHTGLPVLAAISRFHR